MTNAEARFNKIHIRKVYACLAVTCHLHFWQNDRDFLLATVVTRGGTDTEIRVSTESRPWRRKFSRRSSRDSNPRPFNHESGALTTELSPPPNPHHWGLRGLLRRPLISRCLVKRGILLHTRAYIGVLPRRLHRLLARRVGVASPKKKRKEMRGC